MERAQDFIREVHFSILLVLDCNAENIWVQDTWLLSLRALSKVGGRVPIKSSVRPSNSLVHLDIQFLCTFKPTDAEFTILSLLILDSSQKNVPALPALLLLLFLLRDLLLHHLVNLCLNLVNHLRRHQLIYVSLIKLFRHPIWSVSIADALELFGVNVFEHQLFVEHFDKSGVLHHLEKADQSAFQILNPAFLLIDNLLD